MRKSKWNRVTSICVAFSMATILLSGCAVESTKTMQMEPMDMEQSYAISFDIIGGKDVMPIAGYYGPYAATYSEDGQSPPNYVTEEYWQMIADCGINVMSYSPLDYATFPEEVYKNLEFGEKYNMAVVVTDSDVINMAQDEISMEELTTRLSNYMTHPAFGGLYVIDEPCTDYYVPAGKDAPQRYLSYYEKLAPILNQKIKMFTYTNAYPSGTEKTEYERYEKYIREFVDTLQPNYLLYDRYPFDEGQEDHIDRYFFDLAVVRKVAQENKIPFWTYVQAGSQWNDENGRFDSQTPYYPTEGEMDWSVNTALAFGAQGINYFPLIQPYHFAYAESTAFDFQRNGLIGAWGNKNQWYYYAQELSRHIQAIDEVLMNSVNKGVLACGEQIKKEMALTQNYDVLLEGTSWRELEDVEGNALIGCFNFQGKTALYVVNYSTEYSQHINLSFKDTCNFTVIQEGETKDLQGKGTTLNMLPGEGVLLVFE